MLRFVVRLVFCAVMIAVLSVEMLAQCSAGAPGLDLCFPSQGSTVLYPATIEMAANSGGVAITHVSVYDGNKKVDDLGFLPAQLVDGSLQNGLHHITVNAWDADGKLYQAKTSFTVTGFGVGSCAAGSGTINLCWPAAGSYQPESATIAAAFHAGVKSWSITVDGKALINSGQTGESASSPITATTFATAGSHTLVVKAVDAQGTASTVTRQFSTFYDLNCNPKSGACTPGISIVSPSDVSEGLAGNEPTSFRVQAEVMYNPKPTTKMIVYLDGKNIEQSSGPGITANVNAAKGSHYLVILAWDTTGRLYETYGNVNVY